MQLSLDQTRWILKVLQPERTLGALPGAAALTEPLRAALLGIAPEVYSAEQARMRADAKQAARELLADPEVASLVDLLPVERGAKVVAFGDSHTADPQSWAAILSEVLAARGASLVISAAGGETSTHGLVRIGEAIACRPDWVVFLIGVNDARTQGPSAGKTLVDPGETARNLYELHRRATVEAGARCLWVTPPPVNEERVATHWGLSRFGVRFRNEDIGRVADAVRGLGAPVVDLFSLFGAARTDELLTDDGLHLTLAGQRRVALEIVRAWSRLS